MKPRRTPLSNQVFRLEGGNEDNDLWCELTEDAEGGKVIVSTWELTDKERAEIASGKRIELLVWGSTHPAVALRTEKRMEEQAE